MAKVFISYRRTDSAALTGRVYDRLVARFGRKNVFKDVDDIPPGVNFAANIQQSLAECAAALVVIGRSWLDARDPAGNRRLDNPDDFVRLEVETAQRLGLTVIPVVVEGAAMPSRDDLPPSLQPLALINAVAVRNDPDFTHDMERLIASLERLLDARGPIGLFGRRGNRPAATPPPAGTPNAQPPSSARASAQFSTTVPAESPAAEVLPVVTSVTTPHG
jgi:hypothetical protein